MSLARPTFEGASWRISMRCIDRKYMLTPTPEVVVAVSFALAIACERYGVMLHSASCMSNHVHLDVTCPYDHLSDFRRDFKSKVARSLNCHYGRWEYFWSDNDGMQEINSAEAAAAGMAYTITNPIVAGLVAGPQAWPGLSTRLGDLASNENACPSWVVQKPHFFYRLEEDGGLPDEATLTLTPHPLAKDPERFVADIRRRATKIIATKRAEVKAAGKTFAGAEAVLARKWWECPKTTAERRGLNPRFAEPDKARRIRRLVKYKKWLGEYAESLALWRRTGKAVFPPGTNKMRTFPGVTVRDGP